MILDSRSPMSRGSILSINVSLSILVTSSMSSVSVCSLAAFLDNACIISSLLSGCFCNSSEYDRIAWVGVLSSWLAILINSFCILSVLFSSSFSVRSFQNNSNIDLNDSTLRLLLEYITRPIASEKFSALGSLSSALRNLSSSTIYIPYGELLPSRTSIAGAFSDILLIMCEFSLDKGQSILTSTPFCDEFIISSITPNLSNLIIDLSLGRWISTS